MVNKSNARKKGQEIVSNGPMTIINFSDKLLKSLSEDFASRSHGQKKKKKRSRRRRR